ncbi:MAG TPA: diaminopimelate epimerase [bacterium]|nr:diaminopimelate epimerase [bacterium]
MINFFKYQAAGNDFVIVKEPALTSENAENICDRHFGVGADGVLIHFFSNTADAGMKIFNSDGSTAQMCGNGLRCFVSYLITDCGLKKNPLKIETGRGELEVKWEKLKNGKLSIEANLGRPELKQNEIVEFNNKKFDAYSISMGNPHLVLFPSEKPDAMEIRSIANHFQKNNSCRAEVNVEIITDINKRSKSVFVIVKERGAGFTLACGTGGAAVMHSLLRRKIVRFDENWKVFFPGGEITYCINSGNEILMTGVPEKIFEGTLDIAEF